MLGYLFVSFQVSSGATLFSGLIEITTRTSRPDYVELLGNFLLPLSLSHYLYVEVSLHE